MPITLSCPACEKPIKVRDELAGKKARCPSCKHVFPVPALTNPNEASPAAASILPFDTNPPAMPVLADDPPPAPRYPGGDWTPHIALPPRPSQPVLPWVLFAATLAVLIAVLGTLFIERASKGDESRANVLMLALLWICQIIVVPMIGGFFLWIGCKLTKISPAPYLRCWLAYLAAFAAASCVCVPLFLLMPRVVGIPGTSTLLLMLGAAIGIHWLVVPVVLRAGFVRSLLAQTFGILMTASLIVLLSIPVILSLRNRAYLVIDLNSIREIGLAMRQFEVEHHRYPAHAIYDKDKKRPLLSWRVRLLPYLEQEALFRAFRLDEPWNSDHNIQLLPKMPKVYACAAKGPGQTTTHFQVFTSVFPHKTVILTPFPRTDIVSVNMNQIHDGMFATIMITESANAVPWTKPEDMDYDPDGPLPTLGAQPGKRDCHALYFDNSVRRISVNADPEMLRRLITHRDGKDVQFNLVEPR
jgi:hypothetical protein